MSIVTSREQLRQLARENTKLPVTLQEVPRAQWPNTAGSQQSVWRSRDYLVQVFPGEGPVLARLSINRTALNGSGRWIDGLSWEDMQRLKSECGYADFDAVEVFPAQRDVVNVANMRHLWVMREPLGFAWRRA